MLTFVVSPQRLSVLRVLPCQFGPTEKYLKTQITALERANILAADTDLETGRPFGVVFCRCLGEYKSLAVVSVGKLNWFSPHVFSDTGLVDRVRVPIIRPLTFE